MLQAFLSKLANTIPQMNDTLRIIHIPVSSGDCAIVIFPTNKIMMIDTGTAKRYEDIVQPFLDRHCIDHIDYLVKTHNHKDHVGGEIVMKANGIIDEETIIWDWESFHYEDEFLLEHVHFFIYNARDIDFHGKDANFNSLAFRMEYNNWIYTTGGDEGLKSMERFLLDHPDLVPAHVRKIAHHMWGPISVHFLRKTNAYLYITTNAKNIIGMRSPWDDWKTKFIPHVVDYLHENNGRIDDPGYALTGVDGFIYIQVRSGSDWTYHTDLYNNRWQYKLEYWTRCMDPNQMSLLAAYISQNVPSTIISSETISVSITMQNIGNMDWMEDYFIRLMSLNPVGNRIWGRNRVKLPKNRYVSNGENWTFDFEITAPAIEGVYDFQWQLVNEGMTGDIGRFGPTTPNIVIHVVNRTTILQENQTNSISNESWNSEQIASPNNDVITNSVGLAEVVNSTIAVQGNQSNIPNNQVNSSQSLEEFSDPINSILVPQENQTDIQNTIVPGKQMLDDFSSELLVGSSNTTNFATISIENQTDKTPNDYTVSENSFSQEQITLQHDDMMLALEGLYDAMNTIATSQGNETIVPNDGMNSENIISEEQVYSQKEDHNSLSNDVSSVELERPFIDEESFLIHAGNISYHKTYHTP